MLRQFALAVHSAIHVFFLVPRLHESEVAEHAIAEAYLLCQRVPGRIGSADQRRTKAGNGGNQQKDAHKEKRVIESGQFSRRGRDLPGEQAHRQGGSP